MRVVPDKQDERIDFFANRLAAWRANAAELGLSEAELDGLAAAVEATRAARIAAARARQAAQTATQALRQADRTMATRGAAALARIRATARTAGAGTYPLAQVPTPAKASPIAPPGKPTNFAVALSALGWVELTWRCPNPPGASGTMYQVYRRLSEGGGGGSFEYIGTADGRRYVDATVPAGTASVTYQVRAVRARTTGPWAQFNVHFGAAGTARAIFAPPRAA